MKNKKNVSILLLVIAVAFLSTSFIVVGYDYYWHIKAGNYMINNHTILTNDIFSWFVNGKYWMSHEWLFECIIYLFKVLFGKYHILFYCFSNILILLLILFFFNRKNNKKNTLFTIIWLSLFLFINFGLITPRPHLISSWLLAITLYLLYDLRKNENSNKIFFLPLISIFWANVHGGSSNLSYILCLIFIFSGLFSINTRKININKISKIQLKKYIIVLILIIISININPHGYKMLIYPYENIFNKFMQVNIAEWHSISFKDGYHYTYIFTIILIVIMIFKSKKKIKLVDLLLLIFFSYMGLRSIRFWNYIYISSSFFIFDYIKERKDDKNTNQLLIITSIIIIVISIFQLPKSQKRIENNKIISTKIINEIKNDKPKKLFNLYDFGGYLIYNDIDVFVDGRADLYSKYNYKDYINISNLTKNYKDLIRKYDFDYYLVNKKFRIYNYLKNNNNYIEVLKDKNSILYKKKSR